MNKKIISALTFLLVLERAFPEKIIVAPFAAYGPDSERIEPPENPGSYIYGMLEEKWLEGLLNPSLPSGKDAGEILTVTDASRTCVTEGASFIIYGYVKKDEGHWFSEAKLYSASSRKIEAQFFASDDTGHYGRLLETLGKNILTGLSELTGLPAEGSLKNVMSPAELRIRPALFWWVPLNRKWGSRIAGIAGTGASAEFTPSQKNPVVRNMKVDFSFRADSFWSCGANQENAYPLFLNNISLSSPAVVRAHFDTKNSAYAGFGPGCELSLMTIMPKYESGKLLYQSSFFLVLIAGYEYALSESTRLFTESAFNFRLTGCPYASASFILGASFRILPDAGRCRDKKGRKTR